MQSVLGSTVGNAPISVTYGGHAAISDGAELTKAQVSAIAHIASLAATNGMHGMHGMQSPMKQPISKLHCCKDEIWTAGSTNGMVLTACRPHMRPL
jgi:hypothetical protein